MLKSRRELLDIIRQNEKLTKTFNSWSAKRREEFLDFCSGARGVKILPSLKKMLLCKQPFSKLPN